jgi:hypothetical protein
MLTSLPVVAEIDVLVLGGAAAGVAAALEARAAGKRVLMAAPRAYLGEDIAGRLALWPQRNGLPVTQLASRLFGDFSAPPTLMHVKLTLETAAIDAGVEVLLQTCPLAPVIDGGGRIAGAVIANRAGRQVVLAGQVIDASVEGTFARLAGHAPSPLWRGWQRVSHITLCHGEGRAATGVECTRLSDVTGTLDGAAYRLSARRYFLELDLGDGSPAAIARAQAEAIDRCWVPEQFMHQEHVAFDRPAPTGAVADVSGCVLADGLAVLTSGTSLPDELSIALDHPLAALQIGERIGGLIARQAARDASDRSSLTVGCHGAERVESGQIRSLTDPLRAVGRSVRTLPVDLAVLPRLGTYDVLVVGGGTGGAPAAMAAAEAGARTAVVEVMPALGGVGTLGQITRYWFGNRVGFTAAMDEGVRAMEFRDALRQPQAGWSVAAKSAWLHRQCHRRGVDLWMRTMSAGVWVQDGALRGVVVAGPYGYGLIEARVIIDSTGSADVPAAAGAETVEVGAGHVAVQGTGLTGVHPGSDYHNSDHNFCDDTDAVDSSAFLLATKRKYARFFDAGQLIDSRERRQIVGELSLDPVDFLYQRRFPDTICVASSNFDSHGYTIHPLFLVKSPRKERLWVDVPYRCLLPRGLKGVLVTGLGVSAHRDALPVIRMQADVQNQGYAAGRAAAPAAGVGVDVREIDLRALQRQLVEIGSLPARVLEDRDSFPVDESVLDDAIARGWDEFAGLALIFAEPSRSRPKLRAALQSSPDPAARERYALVLALMDDASGADLLRQRLEAADWDEGWNYRGMGQFGMSSSPVDALVIALGRAGDADAWPVLIGQAKALAERSRGSGQLPEFSHVRAIAEGFEALHARHPNAVAGEALAELLALPGMAGHAQTSLTHVLSAVTPDPHENAVRNSALRELHLGRALLHCGDWQGLGTRTLGSYAGDYRGHFARHAAANLHAHQSA